MRPGCQATSWRPHPQPAGLHRQLGDDPTARIASPYCTRTHSTVFDMKPEPATISNPLAVSLIVIGTN